MLQGIFSLFNSFSDKQIKISTILIDDFIQNDLKTEDFENISNHTNEIENGQIEIVSVDHEHINYLLKGIIKSDKTFQKSINKIKTKKEVSKEILYIKHFVEIKEIERKEYNNICYYNYSKEEKYKLPKKIISIKIELFEGIITSQKNIKFNLIAEKYITL